MLHQNVTYPARLQGERERERDYTFSSHTGLIKRPTYLKPSVAHTSLILENMHPSTQTSINCQKGLQGCLWMYVGPNQRQVKGRTWTQITGQTDCACCGWVQPFAVIVKTAQILAITALLGETSKGGTQCPTMLAATCIAKLLHSSM